MPAARSPLRIGLVYDVFGTYPWQPGDPSDADAEFEPEATVEALERAVRTLGAVPVRLGGPADVLRRMPDLGVDAAVNIAEGVRSRNREAYAPILLELAGVPCLGSDALTLSLSLDKAWTKDLAIAAGVPTPPYRVYASAEAIDPDALPGAWPLFVKPRYEGTGKGITPESKVHTLDALATQVARLTQGYRQDVIVEPFVSGGGEFTVAVVGNDPPQPLPVLQRAVEVTTEIGLHVLERRGLPARDWDYRLERLDADLDAQMQRHAVAVYDKLECKDFARVDFRVDEEGQPWFLEINPLPTFAPSDTFSVVAELMNRDYTDFLAEVLARGLRRLGVPSSSINVNLFLQNFQSF